MIFYKRSKIMGVGERRCSARELDSRSELWRKVRVLESVARALRELA